MLVGTVCELLKDEHKGRLWQNELSPEPTIQFLRHVRNGIFHGNHFTFDHGPPQNAVWRGWEITSEMGDELVFSEIKDIDYSSVPSSATEITDTHIEVEEGFKDAGDAFALVDDVIKIVEEASNR